MRSVRYLPYLVMLALLCGCGKSSKLASMLPEAPEGWRAEGGATNNDVSGVGHSSTRSYVPSGNTSGVQRVTVQILLAEKGADQKKLEGMSIQTKAEFKERKQVGGYPAFESFPLPSNDSHSLDVLPKSGMHVQVVAYKGGAGWEKGETRQSTVALFARKLDLKKIAAVE